MKLQKLLSYTRQALDEYQMIQEGDKIAVGISGGKDSLTLLYALTHLQKFYPKKFFGLIYRGFCKENTKIHDIIPIMSNMPIIFWLCYRAGRAVCVFSFLHQ